MINRLLLALAATLALAAGVPTFLYTPRDHGYAGPGSHLIVVALIVAALALLTAHFRSAYAHGNAATATTGTHALPYCAEREAEVGDAFYFGCRAARTHAPLTCHHGPVSHLTSEPCPVFTSLALDAL